MSRLLGSDERKRLLREADALEKESKALMSKALSLRSEVNASTPVSQLSAEILERIFYMASRENKTLLERFFSRSPMWDWMIITKICRRWRMVALNYPYLWTEIRSFTIKEKIKAFLERSQKAELVVSLGGFKFGKSDVLTSDTIKLFDGALGRVKELELDACQNAEIYEEMSRSFRTNSLSRLKILRLRFHNTNFSPNELLNLKISFWDIPFADVSLKTFEIDKFPMYWGHTLFQGLTELRLNDLEESEQPSLSELLDILKNCPGLEFLDIKNAGPKISPSSSSKSQPVGLPRLHRVNIHMVDSTVCSELFDSLELPEYLECGILFEDFPTENPFPLSPQLVGHTMGGSYHLQINIRHDKIVFTWEDDFKFDTYLAFSWEEWDVPFSNFDINVRNLFGSFETIFGQQIWNEKTDILISLYDDNGYNLPSFIGKDEYMMLLRQIPQIAKLTFINHNIDPQVTFIQALVESTSGQLQNNFMCPNLQDLKLRNHAFGYQHDELAYTAFVNNLKRRSRSGKMLGDITFIKCHMKEENIIGFLKQVVCRAVFWTEDLKTWKTGSVDDATKEIKIGGLIVT